jgi:serine/threonine protein phosphatase 1
MDRVVDVADGCLMTSLGRRWQRGPDRRVVRVDSATYVPLSRGTEPLMLSKLLKSRQSPLILPTIPDGQRVYAIGDVHGCLDELDRLLAQIDTDDAGREPATTSLVFLGDLVDRGPASAKVVERVRKLVASRANIRCLLGNHEEVFLDALDGDEKALRLFCRIGGRETALSYGIDPLAYERADYHELGAALAAAVPESHRAFLAGLEDMISIGGYVFVHAGVRPDRSFDDQRLSDLRWIRDTFLHHGRPLDKMVVHGHTIADQVEVRPHRIGIDTGAYATGRLTALGLEHDGHWVLQT